MALTESVLPQAFPNYLRNRRANNIFHKVVFEASFLNRDIVQADGYSRGVHGIVKRSGAVNFVKLLLRHRFILLVVLNERNIFFAVNLLEPFGFKNVLFFGI